MLGLTLSSFVVAGTHDILPLEYFCRRSEDTMFDMILREAGVASGFRRVVWTEMTVGSFSGRKLVKMLHENMPLLNAWYVFLLKSDRSNAQNACSNLSKAQFSRARPLMSGLSPDSSTICVVAAPKGGDAWSDTSFAQMMMGKNVTMMMGVSKSENVPLLVSNDWHLLRRFVVHLSVFPSVCRFCFFHFCFFRCVYQRGDRQNSMGSASADADGWPAESVDKCWRHVTDDHRRQGRRKRAARNCALWRQRRRHCPFRPGMVSTPEQRAAVEEGEDGKLCLPLPSHYGGLYVARVVTNRCLSVCLSVCLSEMGGHPGLRQKEPACARSRGGGQRV